MNGGPAGSARDGETRRGETAWVERLLDQAVAAMNRGDRAYAAALAEDVLAVDSGNVDAEGLLAAPGAGGEMRRLTLLFADLVDSTALSTITEPETYRLLVGGYRDHVLRIVDRYGGHIGSTKGDGLLAVFGHPNAHEDDVRRAVQAGLEITRAVVRLSEHARRRFRTEIRVRVGVHRGLVYLDTAQDDVYGLTANLTARICGLAPSDAVVVSDTVAALVRNDFRLDECPTVLVKGVEQPVTHYRVVGERAISARHEAGLLVGRDRELARLQESWAQARAGTWTTPGIAFRGEAGIGKSRLATAAAEHVEAAGATVLELTGSPLHTDVGLHPVRALIERRCGIDRSTGVGERLRLLEDEVRARGMDVATTVALLAPVLGIDAKAGYQPAPAQGRKLYEVIAQTVRDYLLACLAGAGLVIAEDVHWFDPSTKEIVGSLLRAAAGVVVVVLTGRGTEWLPSDWPVEAFDLHPLTDEQSDELVAALAPGLSPDDRAAVAHRCDGVPFYIGQVVAGLNESGVPEALYEPLFARLRTSSNVVPVVEASAVIGRTVDRELLCAVVQLSDEKVSTVLTELEQALVMEPREADTWRFRHALLREVAAELAPPSVARRLHARVAEALAERGEGEPDWPLIADHYEKAERFDESAAAYKQASAQARRRGALAEARNHLSHGIAALDHLEPDPRVDRRKISLLMRRGFLGWAAGGVATIDGTADLQRCLELGGSNLRDDELFAILVALSSHYAGRADLSRALQIDHLLRKGLDEGRQWSRAIVESQVGTIEWLRGEYGSARCHLDEALQASPTERSSDVVSFIPLDPVDNARLHAGLLHMVQGDHARADAEVGLVLARAERLGFPQGAYTHVLAWFMRVWIWLEAEQFERAAQLAADLAEDAFAHGFDDWHLTGIAMQAGITSLAAASTGRTDQTQLSVAMAHMIACVDDARALEQNIYLTFLDTLLARLYVVAGQPEQARERLELALQLADETGMHFYDAELLRLHAHMASTPAVQEADISAALRVARRQGASLFELRTAIDDYDRRGEAARAALRGAADHVPTDFQGPELARARARLAGTSPDT